MLDYWTGSTLYQLILPQLETSDEEDKRGHCSPLLNQRRAISFFFFFFSSCDAGHMAEGKERRYPDSFHLAPTGGHTGIPANKAPCQPEMHNVELAKVLKAFYGKNVMFHGALCLAWQFEENHLKMKRGDNPIKARRPILTLRTCHRTPVITSGPTGIPSLDSTEF